SILCDSHCGITDVHTSARYTPVGDPAKIIAVVKIRNEHLKIGGVGLRRWRNMLNDRLEKRLHRFTLFVNLAHRIAVARARVNHRKIELKIGGVELNKEIENEIKDL